MACWQKATESLKKFIITEQWNQPWNKSTPLRLGLSSNFEHIHLEHYPKCYSDGVKKYPLIFTCAWLAVSQAPSILADWDSGTCRNVFCQILLAFVWRCQNVFYFLKNILLSYPKNVCWLLSAYECCQYTTDLTEFGDTFGSIPSVMCNYVDASLVRGWYLTIFSFEPIVSLPIEQFWSYIEKSICCLYITNPSSPVLFSGISGRWGQSSTFYSSAERLLFCPGAN